MRKRKKKDAGSGAYWMDTYGDMVTLLLTFFVLLYAFSSVDETKWNKLVALVTGVPTQVIAEPIDPAEPIEGLNPDDIIPPVFQYIPQDEEINQDQPGTGTSEEQAEIEAIISDLYERLKGYVKENDLEGVIMVDKQDDFIHIVILEGILFDTGKADIKEAGSKRLDDVSHMIKDSLDGIQMIYVIGHTDVRPIHNSQFEDNWDLSNKRARNTMVYMQDAAEIPPKMMTSMGRGEWDPVDDSGTEEAMAKNRRVEIIVASRNNIGGLFGDE